MACRLLCKMHIHQGNELVAIVEPVGVREEADVGGQFRQSRRGTEVSELLIVSDSQHKRAVPCLEHLIGNDVRMRIAVTLGRSSRREIIHVLVGKYRNLDIEQSHIDVLTLAGALAVQQR